MDELTALYVKAALVVAVSLIAFVVVTRIAWSSNVEIARRAAAWWRSLPDRWRALRDPAFRRRRACIERYEGVVGMVQLNRILHDRARQAFRESRSGSFQEARTKAELDERDAYNDGGLLIAREYFSRLTDEEIGVIAEHLNAGVFEGRAARADLEGFLRDERALASGPAYVAHAHSLRLIARFKHLGTPADAA